MESGKDRNLDMKEAYDIIDSYTKERSLPLRGYLEINRQCNFRCVHCLFQHARLQGKKMSYREICSVISQFANMGIFYLLITGGEPFLRPDFWKIIHFAKRLGFVISINTNASLITEDVTSRLEDIGISGVVATIYGLSEYSYRRVTRSSDSFVKVSKGIDLLIELWQKGQLPSLRLKLALFRENFFEVDKFEKFKKKIGNIGCNCSIEWQYHPCTNKSRAPLKHTLKPSQRKYLARKFPNLFHPPLPSVPSDSNFLCPKGAGRRTVFVNAFGDVTPCSMIEKGVSIRKKPIKEIIDKHPLFIKFRSLTWKDIPKCKACKAVRFCYPCPHDFFIYTDKFASDSPPTLMCQDKMGWEMKRLYKKYIGLKTR